MLHTVNKSPFGKDSLKTCLAYARPGSDILLIEDGVYGAVKGSSAEEMLRASMETCKVYALGPDLKARGVAREKLLDGIEVVGYDGFVRLAADNDKVQSWL